MSTGKTVAIVGAVVIACCGVGTSLALLIYELSNNQQTVATDNSASRPLDAAQANTGSGAGTRTAAPSPTDPIAAGKVGQAVDGHTFRFTATKVKCGRAEVRHEAFSEDAKGQFCVVTLAVKNISGTAAPFPDSMASAVDPDGVAYESDIPAMFVANWKGNHRPFYGKIKPGDSLTGILVFDIPTNITSINIHLPDGPTGTVSIATG